MTLNRLLVTLVRHGESQDNQQGIWAGFRDTPLTINGVGQARALGQSFANVPLTAIYCSDLKRAAMTADEILKSNRSIPPPPLVQSMSLREINFGQAEGQSYASAEWVQGSSGEEARHFHFPDGESLEEVNARIAKAVRQFILPRVEALRKKPPSEQSAAADVAHICIVAHGIAIAELLRVFMALHDDSPSSPWSDPKTTYQRVRLENTGWSRLELAVPARRDDELPSPTDSDAASPVKPDASSSRPAPVVSTTTSARPNAQSDYTDFGEVQTDLVEGPADMTSKTPSRSPLPSSESASASRPIYVRILCQNQTDHLRGFSAQQGSITSAAKTVAHLAGGGSASKASTSAGSGAANAGSNQSASAAAVGLPASATLASIASNATGSNTNANTAMGPTTPTPGAAAASASNTPKPFTPTAISTRNLSSYDPRMMARELERAGASSMLAGSDAPPSSSASTYFPSPTAASILAADRQASIGGHAGTSGGTSTSGGLDRGSISASPGVSGSLGATHTTPFSGGAYPQGVSTSVTGTTSPNPAGMAFPTGPSTSSDTWQMICIRVLPLFNGEALRTSIEDLNEMVSLHVRKTLDRGQSHAVESLTLDIMSLASTGILTINSKLQGLDDTRLLLRLVEVWTFFLGQVLPYYEACLLPIQTDPSIRSLIATSSSYGAAAGSGASNIVGPFNTSSTFAPSNSNAAAAIHHGLATQRIDVRRLLLIVFRDQVLLPMQERLFHLFAHLAELDPAFAAAESNNISGGGGGDDDGIKQVSLRLLQMTSVLASILSEDEAQEAVDGLLRALRLGSKGTTTGRHRGIGDSQGARAASPTQRNNRHGWMAQKARKHGPSLESEADVSASAYVNGPSSLPQPILDGSSIAPHAPFGTRPSHLNSLRDVLGPQFGPEMTEDEYLTSLRSPGGSSAISTPGQPEAPATHVVDSANSSSKAANDPFTHPRSGNESAATTPMTGSRADVSFHTDANEGEQALAPPTALAA